MTIQQETASERVPLRRSLPEAPQGMTGENIICFAKDWSEDPTSNNYVMRQLSQNNRVLWLNSIATRTPSITSGRDIRKIARKIGKFFRGVECIQGDLWVYTPLVIPVPHNKIAVQLNRLILRSTLALLRHRLKMKRFQLWTFVPTAAPYMTSLGSDLTVYYCTDNYAGFRGVDTGRMETIVQSLARQSDVVFATSQPLVEKLLPFNSETHLASHGVKFELFASALSESTVVPPDLAALSGPVLGFYGLIEDWLDQDLIAYLAQRHPEWNIALVGKTCVDISALERFPNVYFLGRKPHAELPAYCKGFDVGLIPHKVNELTRHMNPIKLREYLSAGLPIVSTALPEMRNYPEYCTVAESYEAFERGIDAALKKDSPARRQQRSEAMRGENWERKVAELGETVLCVKSRKGI